MDSLLPSLDASGKATGLSGLLSSLGALLEGSAANPGVFEQFLEQSQLSVLPSASEQAQSQASTQAPPIEPNNNDVPSANTISGSGQTQNASAGFEQTKPSLPVLKKIIASVHHILERLNRSSKSTAIQKKAPANQADKAQTVTSGTGQNQAPGSVGQKQGGTDPRSGNAEVAVSTDSSAAAGVSGDTQTPTQLLSQLVTLMQMIEKKLESLQAGIGKSSSGQPPSGSAGNTLPGGITPQLGSAIPDPAAPTNAPLSGKDDNAQTSDVNPSDAAGSPLGAADPLTQLLGLLQAIEKKLAVSSDDGTQALAAAGTVPPANTETPALPLVSKSDLAPIQIPNFLEVEKDLQSVLSALRDAIAQGVTGNASNVNAANDSGGPSGTPSVNQKTDVAQNDKSLVAPLNDLSDIFGAKTNSIFGGAPSADGNSFASGNMNLVMGGGAGDKGDGLLEQDAQNGAGTAANTQLTPNNPALTALSDGVSSPNPYSFASQLSALRAVNGGTTGLPSVVEQVLLQLNRGVKDGNDQMTIQLQPADLGKINIKLDITSDGKVQGTVVADNPATLNLLLKDVRGLERALQEAGLRADSGSLQFSLGNPSGNASGQTANNFTSNGSSTNTSSFDTSGSVPDISAAADEVWYMTPSRVNFKV